MAFMKHGTWILKSNYSNDNINNSCNNNSRVYYIYYGKQTLYVGALFQFFFGVRGSKQAT